jgi:hypothetical protein
MENLNFQGLKLVPKINKLDEKLLSNNLQHVVNKAYDNYSEKPYIIENVGLYRFCVGGAIFGGLLSILAAFLFVLNLFTQIVIGQTISNVSNIVLLVILGVLALAFLLFLEYAKSLLTSAAAKDYQRKGKVSIFVILSLVICLGFSAYTSIQGANSLAILNAQPSENELIKVDSVGKTYDMQITDLQAQIKAAKKNGSGYTWNGALTEKGRNYTERLNAQIMKLTDLKDKNVNGSKEENGKLLESANEKGTYNGAIVMLISAFIELLIIATTIYKERYEFISLQEIGMLNSGELQKGNNVEVVNSEKVNNVEVASSENVNTNDNQKEVVLNDLTTGANSGKKAVVSENKNPNVIGFHTIVNRDKKEPLEVVLNDLSMQVVNNDLQKEVVLNDLQNAQNTTTKTGANCELASENKEVVFNDLERPLQPNEKNCLHCGTSFRVKNKVHKFCTDVCRYEYNENLKGYKVFDIISKKKA